jgi:hypothetical protein
MKIGRGMIKLLLAAGLSLMLATMSVAAVTVDRDYKLGDDGAEGAVTGGSVSTTFDSAGVPGQGQLVDLTAVHSPTYVAISGRPDGVGGRGIQFSSAQQQYLHGFNLGFPENSFSAATHTTRINGTLTGGALDYLGISNRGFQFWARPTSTAVQTLVMDTNQHGVRIDSNGKFAMRYGSVDYESSVSVVPNNWYQIEVVRPAGAANGSRMYINGVAVAIAAGGYNDDWSDVVVGSNTAGDDSGSHPNIPTPQGFTGGTQEFYSGIIDDLAMFVLGTSTSSTPVNYGTFNFAVDNAFAASPISGLKNVAGDVTNNGVFDVSDKNAFIAGWLHTHVINGVQIGDMASRAQGDLNFDGITNIQDLLLMQNALTGAGLGSITAAQLSGVPEPATALLVVLALLPLAVGRSRSHRC